MDFEAKLVTAASEALFPALPEAVHAQVSGRVDAWLTTLPPGLVRQLHAALATLEHGTLLGGELTRFTRLGTAERAALLDTLAERGLAVDDVLKRFTVASARATMSRAWAPSSDQNSAHAERPIAAARKTVVTAVRRRTDF